jgi:hypothetical protein
MKPDISFMAYLMTLQYRYYVASYGRMIDELERMWKEVVVA